MNLNQIFPLAGLGLFIFIPNGFALGQAQYVEKAGGPGSFPIVQPGGAAKIYVDTNDFAGVIRAAADLQSDIARVTGLTRPSLTTKMISGKMPSSSAPIGKSRIIDRLIADHKIDASPIAGKWESFFIQVVPEPLPGVASGLVIAGSDKRGTIYGIYDLSEQMGVSPWYWWADVTPEHKDALFVKAGQICARAAGSQIPRHLSERRSAGPEQLDHQQIRHWSPPTPIRPSRRAWPITTTSFTPSCSS